MEFLIQLAELLFKLFTQISLTNVKDLDSILVRHKIMNPNPDIFGVFNAIIKHKDITQYIWILSRRILWAYKEYRQDSLFFVVMNIL